MSTRHAVMLLSISAASIAISAAGVAAPPAADEMARCASIAAPDTRLACYDALAHRPAEKVPAAAAQPPAPPQTPESATQSAADPNNFGLTPAKQHAGDVGPKAISAHIDNVSAGLSGETTIVLDSDQTWTVLDNDGRLAAGDAVTIKKAALGAFLMMTPSHHSYRVRRIR